MPRCTAWSLPNRLIAWTDLPTGGWAPVYLPCCNPNCLAPADEQELVPTVCCFPRDVYSSFVAVRGDTLPRQSESARVDYITRCGKDRPHAYSSSTLGAESYCFGSSTSTVRFPVEDFGPHLAAGLQVSSFACIRGLDLEREFVVGSRWWSRADLISQTKSCFRRIWRRFW